MKPGHTFLPPFFVALMVLLAGFLPAQEIKVRLAYFPNVTHAQALVGAQRGDFAKALEGRGELVLLPVNAGPTVIEGLFAGEIDIAYVGPSPTLNGHIKARGEVVRLVSGSAFNGVVILGNKGLGITTLEQLRGGRVATPQLGNTQDLAARFFLAERGFNVGTGNGQTRVIPVANPDVETLFARGDLEGAWIPEPWGSRLIARGLANQIAFEHEFWPAGRFALTGIVVRRAFLEQHPDIVRSILAAHMRITEEMQQDSARFVGPINDEIFRITKKRLEDEVIRLSLENVVLDVQPDTDTYQQYLRIGQELGHLDRDAVPLDSLYDFRILRELLDDAGQELNTAAAAKAGPAPREARRTEFLLSAATALLLLGLSVGLHLGWVPAIGGAVWSRRLLPVLFLAALAFGWQGIAALQLFPNYLFPGPLAVVQAIWQLLRDGTLWTSLSSSAGRVILGYTVSVMLGLLLGALLAGSTYAKHTLGTLVLGLQSLPSICWLPFALIWLGLNEKAILMVVILGAVFSISVTTENALRNVAPIYGRVGRTLGAKGFTLTKDILIFAALPEIISGLKVGWTFAWRSLMAAELLRPDALGLGHMLEVGRQFNDMPMMLASVFTILAIGLTVDWVGFASLERAVRRRWGIER